VSITLDADPNRSPSDLSGECIGYGLRVAGLPGDWPGLALDAPRGNLRWSSSPGPLPQQEEVWWSESHYGLSIGWSYEAQYTVSLVPTPSVVVIRGPIDDRQAALSFLLAVLPLALPLFDLEPLHGAAVGLRQGGALLLLGPSGAGKSTTAAAFLARDCAFLADDVCALDPGGMLWPGPPLLATDRVDGRHFATYYDKTVWIPESSLHEPTSVRATILLEPSPKAALSLTRLDTRSAFTGILRHARSRRLLASRRQRTQFLVAAMLARLPVLALAYDQGTHGPPLLADSVIDHLGRHR
jgi:hypothetical protein